MLQKLKELLDCLESTLDPARFARVEELHQRALNWEEVERLPLIMSYPYPEDVKFQPFPHGKTFDDPEKMLFNQLVSAFETSLYLSGEIGDDLPAAIRPDFGVVLVASLFTSHVEQVENNPPWVRHHNGKADITCSQIDRDYQVDYEGGWVPRVLSRYRYYRDVIDNYPNLCKIINITLPDLQGSLDNLELICGSDVFMDMCIQKESFIEALKVVAKAQMGLIERLNKYTDEKISGISHQHNFPIKGGVLLRNDTSTMISAEMYREMVRPCDDMILERFGGGIHSCGNVNDVLPEFLACKNMQCFDFGQSELNDIDAVYQLAKERKIPLLRIAATAEELVDAKIKDKYPTGISLIFRAKSFEHAKSVASNYFAASFR